MKALTSGKKSGSSAAGLIHLHLGQTVFVHLHLNRLRILHITPWFPTSANPLEGVWIQRHIESLRPFADQHVIHHHQEWGSGDTERHEEEGFSYVHQFLSFHSWRWREWQMALLIRHELVSRRVSEEFDVINFHIAYPSLVHLHLYKSLLPKSVLITEHWSEYHFRFRRNSPIRRVQRIFKKNIPLIVVSDQLGKDINTFTGGKVPFTVIPNAIDCEIFRHKEIPAQPYLLMAAYWKDPKKPLAILTEIAANKSRWSKYKLHIAGDGPLLEGMKQFVRESGLQDIVDFKGILSPEQMASQMQGAQAFLMSSGFETFSVVCAEALCCGCPVIADNAGALKELIQTDNGLLREEDCSWTEAMNRFESLSFDRAKISQTAQEKYSMKRVGEKYYSFILNPR